MRPKFYQQKKLRLIIFRRTRFSKLDEKGKLLKLNRKIDGYQFHTRRQPQEHGSKVEHSSDTCFDQYVGNILRRLGRNGQNSKFGAQRGDSLTDRLKRLDYHAFDDLTDLGRVCVEESDDVEPLSPEAAVPEQCSCEITDPGEDGTPGSVDPECGSNRGNELFGFITDPALAQTA